MIVLSYFFYPYKTKIGTKQEIKKVVPKMAFFIAYDYVYKIEEVCKSTRAQFP